METTQTSETPEQTSINKCEKICEEFDGLKRRRTVIYLDEILNYLYCCYIPRYVRVLVKFAQHFSALHNAMEWRIYKDNETLIVDSYRSRLYVNVKGLISFIREKGNETRVDIVEVDNETAKEVIEHIYDWLEDLIKSNSLHEFSVLTKWL